MTSLDMLDMEEYLWPRAPGSGGRFAMTDDRQKLYGFAVLGKSSEGDAMMAVELTRLSGSVVYSLVFYGRTGMKWIADLGAAVVGVTELSVRRPADNSYVTGADVRICRAKLSK